MTCCDGLRSFPDLKRGHFRHHSTTLKNWLLLASCNTEAVDFNMRDAQTNIL